MTSEMQDNVRISKLEKRVIKLEKIVLEKEDILHKNFEGYETPTDEEIELIDEANLEMKRKLEICLNNQDTDILL